MKNFMESHEIKVANEEEMKNKYYKIYIFKNII